MYYAMSEIMSLQYKNVISDSTDCRKSNRLLRQPHPLLKTARTFRSRLSENISSFYKTRNISFFSALSECSMLKKDKSM